MRKVKQRILAVLLAVSMVAVSAPAVPAPAVAEAATQDVVTLNATSLTNWAVGKQGSFYAYVNGKRVANSTLTWTSSNTAVAICENGLLTAVGAGTATITCTKENAVAATCTVTVKGNDIVTLNATSLTNWTVGKTGSFYAYVNGKRVANNTMTWSSSNTAVATCENGVLKAVGAGTAIISCTRANATTATCTVTVKGNDVVTLNVTSLTNWTVGKTGNFYAYVNGKRVANNTLTWSSSNPSVATCENGVLTAVGAGTAVISCTKAGATTATCTVTVKGNDVVTLNVTSLTDWPVGKTGSFYAYVNGRRVANNTMTWSSSNTAVATCENGVLTAVGAGTATITCTKAGATTATCTVTVKGEDVVTLNVTSLTNWTVGKTGTFYAYVNGRRVANNTMTWSSSNPSVATCVNGVLTAKGPGTAVISCTKANATVATCTVTVKADTPATDVSSLKYRVLTNGTVRIMGVTDKNITAISIPEYIDGKKVTEIGNSAFYGCSCLETVTIPGSVKKIGGSAFGECSVLKNITIPEGVEEIGAYAFYLNRGLSEIILPDSVINVGEAAFYGCYNVVKVRIPNNNTSFGVDAFAIHNAQLMFEVDVDNQYFVLVDGVLFNKNKTKLIQMPGGALKTNYVVPEGVVEIGASAFVLILNLQTVTLPNSLVTIGERAFSDTYLEQIHIPQKVSTIGAGALNCCNLKDITVDAGNQYFKVVNGVLFDKNMKTLVAAPRAKDYGIYTVPNGVTTIYPYAFCLVNSVEQVIIPNSVVTIGEMAFFATSIKELELPNSVVTIGIQAFSACDSLTEVVIPNSVTTIENSAFSQCDNLEKVTVPASVTSIGYRAFESGVIIITTRGSYADTYAQQNGLTVQYQ